MNATSHRLIGALTLTVVAASISPKQEEIAARAAVGCVGGYCFGTLPDLIEPATSPNHRRFFHSLTFAVAMCYGLYRLNQWEPVSAEMKALRIIGLIAGGAYLVHLALDATTKRSLPLIGRLP